MYNYKDSAGTENFEKIVSDFIEFKKSRGEEPILPASVEECRSYPEESLYIMDLGEKSSWKNSYSIIHEEEEVYSTSETAPYGDLPEYYDPGVMPETPQSNYGADAVPIPMEDRDEIMDLDSDMDYMRHLTGEINQRLYPFIVEVLNEHEYEGSPLLEEHPDRELMAQIVDKVLERAAQSIEDVEEIHLDAERSPWCRYRLLRSLTEINVLNELYGCRRPRYRRVIRRRPLWY